MFRNALAVSLVVGLAACGNGANKPSATKPTSDKVSAAAKANQSALKTQKPATAMKVMQSPKPLPAQKSAGATTVKPPDLTKGGTVEVETWAFENVDLDGDGTGETGIVLADDTRLLALWSGAFVDANGATVSYDGLVWLDGSSSVGFILDFGSAGALACAETASGSAGCVACDAGGTCSEAGVSQ